MSRVAGKTLRRIFPGWQNTLLALAAAGLLMLAFPDFEWWWTAWFALVPLMWAVEREKASSWRSFLLGWLFGTASFFGTCWWLTYAPIHYAAVPWPLAYLLIFIVCLMAGLFPGIFAGILALLLRRFASWAFLAAPFVWACTEFARYWVTGNNWNAIGYSQAFGFGLTTLASLGGVLAVSFACLVLNVAIFFAITRRLTGLATATGCVVGLVAIVGVHELSDFWLAARGPSGGRTVAASLIAVQPNVPMSGLEPTTWLTLRENQTDLAASEVKRIRISHEVGGPTTVVLPESPMNYAYTDDREFQQYIGEFARRHYVGVIFNSSEPDKSNGRYFNSALMVGPEGKLAVQYDKVYLLPFGEAVPAPLENIVPAFVGHFSYGSKYDLMPLGDAKAGVMICFESHFGELGRRYVQNGADAIIEMTNDGYLGPTPVLRQHLANAVFRAVETNRPVLRVTNVGITAYIDERGNVHDPLPSYTEGTRVWSISRSDGSQTFYVKYGDWFAWLCTIVTIGLVAVSFRRRISEITDN
jgi:apolipoprotein N-acyltransferase